MIHKTMNLQAVVTMPFHRAVRTNYLEWRARKEGDCVLIRSVVGRSLAFCHGFYGIEDENGITHIVFSHERLDLEPGEEFSELMIANYASRVGIKLVGVKRLEEHFKWLQSEDYV